MEAVRKILSVDMLSPIVSLPWKNDMKGVETLRATSLASEDRINSPNATLSKTPRLSDQFRGVFSKEAGESFLKHIKEMREEW
jgi:hypothetical protein